MKFDRIHSDIDFSCLNGNINENTNDIFTRKLWSDILKNKDFKSKWEQGRRPPSNDRKLICRFKGISLNKYENDEDIIKLYTRLHQQVRSFKRKVKPGKYYAKFRFKSGAGKLWMTGNKKPFHYTFFKSDNFSTGLIDIVEIRGF